MSSNRAITAITSQVTQQILNAGGTVAGAEWAFQTLDPFHDCELPNVRGAPIGTGMSVVHQVIREQITIKKPAGVSTTGWDCHIILLPIASWTQFSQGGLVEEQFVSNIATPNIQPVFVGDTQTFINMGTLTALSGPVGFNANACPTVGNQIVSTQLQPSNIYTNGGYRVSAQAFEVRSVGPELYKSGTCNMWRIPTPELSASVVANNRNYTSTTLVGAAYVSSVIMDAWPATETEATLIPNTITGLAKDGCYVVARMNTMFPQIYDSNGQTFIFRTPSQTCGLVYQSGGPGVATVVTPSLGPQIPSLSLTMNGGASFLMPTSYSTAISQFDMCGAQFMGLSDSDVLTITVKFIITRYPTERQPEILVMGKAAPEFDPVALQWYSYHVSRLPTGVPVKDNALGDWFRSVVGKVAGFVKPIIPMATNVLSMAGPKGKAAAALLSSLSSEKRKVKEANKKVDKVQHELKAVKSQVSHMTQKSGKKNNKK